MEDLKQKQKQKQINNNFSIKNFNGTLSRVVPPKIDRNLIIDNKMYICSQNQSEGSNSELDDIELRPERTVPEIQETSSLVNVNLVKFNSSVNNLVLDDFVYTSSDNDCNGRISQFKEDSLYRPTSCSDTDVVVSCNKCVISALDVDSADSVTGASPPISHSKECLCNFNQLSPCRTVRDHKISRFRKLSKRKLSSWNLSPSMADTDINSSVYNSRVIDLKFVNLKDPLPPPVPSGFIGYYKEDLFIWSDINIFTVQYNPRTRKWSKTPSFSRGSYKGGINISSSGGVVIKVNIGNDKNKTIMNIEGPFANENFPLRFTVEDADYGLTPSCPTTCQSPIWLTIHISKGTIGSQPGIDKPVWVCDHKQDPEQLSRVRSFKLHREGIEVNPGPPKRLSVGKEYVFVKYVRHLLAENSPNSRIIAGTMFIMNENRFSVLDKDDSKLISELANGVTAYSESLIADVNEAIDSHKESVLRKERRIKQALAGSEPKAGTSKTKPNDNGRETLLEKKQRYANLIKRLCSKLVKEDTNACLWFRSVGRNCRKLTDNVATALWGNEWTEQPELTQCQWAAYCTIFNVSLNEELSAVIDTDPKTRTDYHDLITGVVLDITNHSYVEAKARVHNKLVHSLNGNIFTPDMKAVDESKETINILSEPASPVIMKSGEYDNLLHANINSTNYQYTSSLHSDGLTTDVINSDNTAITNVWIKSPLTPFTPVTTYSVLMAQPIASVPASFEVVLAPTANGYPVISMRLHEYTANQLSATALSTEISTKIQNSGFYRTRDSDTIQSGFLLDDVIQLNGVVSYKGLAIERPVLVWLLWNSFCVIRNRLSGETIPGSWFNCGSQYTKPEFDRGILTWDWNGVDIDLDPKVFPLTGLSGKIRFHVTLKTVAKANQDNAILVPNFVLEAGLNSPLMLALFIMGFAPWPFNMGSISIPDYANRDHLKGQNRTVTLNHFLTNIPGVYSMDIVLPRKNARSNPTDAAAANYTVQTRPRTGSVAIGDLAANANLNVNFTGGNTIEYDLSSFLRTWADDINVTHVRALLCAMNCKYGISRLVESCWDMMVYAVHRSFPMVVDQQMMPASPPDGIVDGTTLSSYDTNAVVNRQYSITFQNIPYYKGSERGGLNTKFPISGTLSSEYYLYETDITSWNKVVSGLATSVEFIPGGGLTMPSQLEDNQSFLAENIRGIQICSAFQIMVHAIGLSGGGWTNIFSNINIIGYAKTIQGLYVQNVDINRFIPSALERALLGIFSFIYKRGLALTPCQSATETNGVVSVFGRSHLTNSGAMSIIDRSKFVKGAWVISYQLGKLYMPTIIPDVWIQLFAVDLPRIHQSFPPPCGLTAVQGYCQGLEMVNFDMDSAGGWTDPKTTNSCFQSQEVTIQNDQSRWNEKLMIFQPVMGPMVRWRYYSGQVNEGWFIVGKMPCLMIPANTYEGTQMAGNILRTSTTCSPWSDENGLRIFPYLPRASVASLYRAEQRIGSLNIPVWRLNGLTPNATLPVYGSKPNVFAQFFHLGLGAAPVPGTPGPSGEQASGGPTTETLDPRGVSQLTNPAVVASTSSSVEASSAPPPVT